MDNILLTSIIAGSSACVGALIPCLFSYIGKKQEFTMGKLAKIEDVRRSEYAVYLDSLQQMINKGNRQDFIELQKSTNRILLYAGEGLSTLVNDYYNSLVERANSGTPLLRNEQEEYQTNIVNAMRIELGVSKKLLTRVRMIRA